MLLDETGDFRSLDRYAAGDLKLNWSLFLEPDLDLGSLLYSSLMSLLIASSSFFLASNSSFIWEELGSLLCMDR